MLITELADKVRRLEERDRTVKQPDPLSPKRTEPPVGPSELEQNPFERPAPAPPVATDSRCDEVSCVLTNYEGACCTKYRHKPDALDRQAIVAGIESVRARHGLRGPARPRTGRSRSTSVFSAKVMSPSSPSPSRRTLRSVTAS